jgi:hypothetical protein
VLVDMTDQELELGCRYDVPDEQGRKVLVEMKIRYDKGTDTLTIVLRDVAVADSDQGRSGVIVDYDAG